MISISNDSSKKLLTQLAKLSQILQDSAVRKKIYISVAESCTGGLIANTLTSLPGASSYFAGAIVSYSNQIKTSLLHIDPFLIKEHGAVSEAVALDMAINCKNIMKTDISLAITGVAGPNIIEDKAIGTIYIAIVKAYKDEDINCARATETINNSSEISVNQDLTRMDTVRTKKDYTKIYTLLLKGDRNNIRLQACLAALKIIIKNI